MKNRAQYHKELRQEIINDPTNQGYNDIFKRKYKNDRDIYTKIAQKINLNRSAELNLPIVRTSVVQLVLRDE